LNVGLCQNGMVDGVRAEVNHDYGPQRWEPQVGKLLLR
jgi:hypothetical protein